jgi:hypothetical protein
MKDLASFRQRSMRIKLTCKGKTTSDKRTKDKSNAKPPGSPSVQAVINELSSDELLLFKGSRAKRNKNTKGNISTKPQTS